MSHQRREDGSIAKLAPSGPDPSNRTDHARWLRQHVAGAEGSVLQDEGHLTLFANRVGDVQDWLRHRLS